MPKKGKLGDEDVEFLVSKDLEEFNKRLDDFGRAVGSKMDDFGTALKELKVSLGKGATPTEAPPKGETPKEYYCPECESYTKDLYEHLKKNPEKHGLVKEVPKKRTMPDILSEHDIFDCPECRKTIDEHLAKKGLEITEEKEKGLTLEL